MGITSSETLFTSSVWFQKMTGFDRPMGRMKPRRLSGRMNLFSDIGDPTFLEMSCCTGRVLSIFSADVWKTTLFKIGSILKDDRSIVR
jgi:hypothetical protein